MARSIKLPIISDPLALALAGLVRIIGLTPEFISPNSHVVPKSVTELASLKVLPPARRPRLQS
jgi:hypothetical protein